jgi:hypothetical protein
MQTNETLLIMIGRTRDTKSRIGSTPLDQWIASKPFGVSIMSKFIVDPEYTSYHDFLIIFINSGRNLFRWKRMRP